MKSTETAVLKDVKVVKKEPALGRSDSTLTRRRALASAEAPKATGTDEPAVSCADVSSTGSESLVSRFPAYSRRLFEDVSV